MIANESDKQQTDPAATENGMRWYDPIEVTASGVVRTDFTGLEPGYEHFADMKGWITGLRRINLLEEILGADPVRA
jgi:hypothetical protein